MPTLSKTFNIPFSGGAATVVCLYKYTLKSDDTSFMYKSNLITQYNADGTTENIGGAADLSLSVSVNSGVMTVTLRYDLMFRITDCLCCLIPGDPFA